MCLTEELVYQAEVIIKNQSARKTNIGMAATTFKNRYRNHKKLFDDMKHENNTKHSKHVWKLKQDNKQFSVNWLSYPE